MSDTVRPLSPWALRAASVLRAAGEDGVSYALLREELGAPPGRALAELRRHRYVVAEQADTFFLVHEPESGEPVAPAPVPPGAAASSRRPSATGSPDSGQLTLDLARAA